MDSQEFVAELIDEGDQALPDGDEGDGDEDNFSETQTEKSAKANSKGTPSSSN